MNCEKCGLHPATVHMTNVHNGVKTEKHLCTNCAREGSDLHVFENTFVPISLKDLFYHMVEQESKAEKRCSGCGMTMARFKSEGRLGCAKCYSDLNEELAPIIRSVQGKLQHTGVKPKTAQKAEKTDKAAELRAQLEEAIKLENYEKAAKLRDTIKKMEKSRGGA